MKCIVRYEKDGEGDFFVIEGDPDKCRREVFSEVERLGLDNELNRIRIDMVLENRRSARVFGIPCWYYVEEDYLEGKNFIYEVLYAAYMAVFSFFSWISRLALGRPIRFRFRVKEIE